MTITTPEASQIVPVQIADWNDSGAPDCVETVERGDVVYLPSLRFELTAGEQALLSPAVVHGAKNVSFDPATGRVGGTDAGGATRDLLHDSLERFSRMARQLVDGLFARYATRTLTGRASFRPVEIAGRVSSWRKDDTRLHVDAFPATPVHGRRILRVFSNVNPAGRARAWRVGGGFEPLAARFAPQLRMPWPGSGTIRHLLHLTKSARSPYDALMLQLHDRMKQDDDFQTGSPQARFDFPAGTTWLAFTDAVSHAAMSGQYQFEQTFLVPVDAMADDRGSPLRILERITRRRLA